MPDFLTDVTTLRRRAREEIERGPVTASYGADRARVLEVLDTVVATELVCYLRYSRHYFAATGIDAAPAAAEFRQHATEELDHAWRVAARITQLGGTPDFDPATLVQRSHAEYVEGDDLRSMIEEDLVAERVAIQSYQEIARWLGDGDPTSRRVIEEILAVEEEHAEDLLSLIDGASMRGAVGARDAVRGDPRPSVVRGATTASGTPSGPVGDGPVSLDEELAAIRRANERADRELEEGRRKAERVAEHVNESLAE